jgi:hypothetical protein
MEFLQQLINNRFILLQRETMCKSCKQSTAKNLCFGDTIAVDLLRKENQPADGSTKYSKTVDY